ncbi:MAG: lysostaphin resistance A-like protein, partial [Alphaproteobacteria bacterium]
VLLEEIAFRAVLFSMLARRYGVVWAIVISSILFGLWHVLPSIGTHEQNPALGSVVGKGWRGNVLAVALSVLTTAVAGILFAGLRLLSGSVLAPMGLHWATNGLLVGRVVEVPELRAADADDGDLVADRCAHRVPLAALTRGAPSSSSCSSRRRRGDGGR